MYDVFEVREGDFGIGPHCPLEHLFQPSKEKKFAFKNKNSTKIIRKSTPEHWTISDLSEMALFSRFEIVYFMKMIENDDCLPFSPKISALRTLRIRSLMKPLPYSANFGSKKLLNPYFISCITGKVKKTPHTTVT